MGLFSYNDMQIFVGDLKKIDLHPMLTLIQEMVTFLGPFGLCTTKLCSYSIRWSREILRSWSRYNQSSSRNIVAPLHERVVFGTGNAHAVLAQRGCGKRRAEVTKAFELLPLQPWPLSSPFLCIANMPTTKSVSRSSTKLKLASKLQILEEEGSIDTIHLCPLLNLENFFPWLIHFAADGLSSFPWLTPAH